MMREKQVIGALFLRKIRPDTFIELLKTFAAQAVIAIEHAAVLLDRLAHSISSSAVTILGRDVMFLPLQRKGAPMTAPDVTSPSSVSGGLDSFNVNLIALLVALVLTAVGVKLTSFLPAKYYFSFSKLVNNDSYTTPFLISTPPYVAADDLCKALEREKSLKQITCDKDKAKDDVDRDDEAYQQEIKVADRAIRQEAQAQDSFTNIIGFAIRLLIPAIAGFIVVRTLGPSQELAASAGAAAAAILLCWPVIVLWKLVVTESFQEMYGQFMLLYVLGAVSFFYMAKIGATFGRILVEAKVFDLGKVFRESSSKIIESSLIAIISSVGIKIVENLVLKS
jgi:hypothetical protein